MAKGIDIHLTDLYSIATKTYTRLFRQSALMVSLDSQLVGWQLLAPH